MPITELLDARRLFWHFIFMTQMKKVRKGAIAKPKRAGGAAKRGAQSSRAREAAEEFKDVVLNDLNWDLAVPPDRVRAKTSKGWVTLTGEVDRPYQKSSAEADVRETRGVVSGTNKIKVGRGTSAGARPDAWSSQALEAAREFKDLHATPVPAKLKGKKSAAIRRAVLSYYRG
jgi:osmotically-inducible protein OsmY